MVVVYTYDGMEEDLWHAVGRCGSGRDGLEHVVLICNCFESGFYLME